METALHIGIHFISGVVLTLVIAIAVDNFLSNLLLGKNDPFKA